MGQEKQMRIKGFWGKDGESLPATSQICWDFYTFVLVTNGIYITYKKFFTALMDFSRYRSIVLKKI